MLTLTTLGFNLNPFAKDNAAPSAPSGTPSLLELYSIISKDPYYPRVATAVKTLQAMEPPNTGIGLKRVVRPLEAYVWSRKHPGLTTVAVASAAFTLPFLGFLIGRIARRSK